MKALKKNALHYALMQLTLTQTGEVGGDNDCSIEEVLRIIKTAVSLQVIKFASDYLAVILFCVVFVGDVFSCGGMCV